MNMGRTEQAIQDFDETIRLDPGYTKAYHNRGNTYTMMHQYEEAIRLDPEISSPTPTGRELSPCSAKMIRSPMTLKKRWGWALTAPLWRRKSRD